MKPRFTLISTILLGIVSLVILLRFFPAVTAKMPQVIAAEPPGGLAMLSHHPAKLTYHKIGMKDANIYWVLVPQDSGYRVMPDVSDKLDYLESFADGKRFPFLINGGYFDPNNTKTTSYVLLKGAVTANPRDNEKLTGNPSLAPFLEQIFNRTEFRVYDCENASTRYDITSHAAPVPTGCNLAASLGAGPMLLPDYGIETEGFVFSKDGKYLRDPIGVDRANARSAIGITDDGSVILIMAAQQAGNSPKKGLSLPGMASLLSSLGAVKAMGLDGGSSSAIYFQGRIVYGKLDPSGKPVKRLIKSVLRVEPVDNAP